MPPGNGLGLFVSRRRSGNCESFKSLRNTPTHFTLAILEGDSGHQSIPGPQWKTGNRALSIWKAKERPMLPGAKRSDS
jgi:hypothetical protein